MYARDWQRGGAHRERTRSTIRISIAMMSPVRVARSEPPCGEFQPSHSCPPSDEVARVSGEEDGDVGFRSIWACSPFPSLYASRLGITPEFDDPLRRQDGAKCLATSSMRTVGIPFAPESPYKLEFLVLASRLLPPLLHKGCTKKMMTRLESRGIVGKLDLPTSSSTRTRPFEGALEVASRQDLSFLNWRRAQEHKKALQQP